MYMGLSIHYFKKGTQSFGSKEIDLRAIVSLYLLSPVLCQTDVQLVMPCICESSQQLPVDEPLKEIRCNDADLLSSQNT